MAQAGDNTKAALVDSLNTLLADYFTLYLKTKNFHWHVAGPRFHDLHLLFDDQATEIFALTDTIAERVRKNSADTLTTLARVVKRSRIEEEESATLDADTMIAQLRDDNRKLIDGIREAKEAAGRAGDNATDGMADDWTDQAEKRAWFLDQLLR